MSTVADPVEEALAAGAAPVQVLDVADEAIEHAAAAGDSATLVRLASSLSDAAARGPEWSGLAIAAARARAVAGAAGPAEPVPPRPVDELVVETPSMKAGWWRRTVAFSVDWMAVGFAIGIVDSVVGGDSEGYALLLACVPLAYFAGMHAFNHGATLGKALLGVSVQITDGRPIGVGRGVMRGIATSVLWLTVIGGLVDMIAGAADANGAWLHDKIAGTVVVRWRARPPSIV